MAAQRLKPLINSFYFGFSMASVFGRVFESLAASTNFILTSNGDDDNENSVLNLVGMFRKRPKMVHVVPEEEAKCSYAKSRVILDDLVGSAIAIDAEQHRHDTMDKTATPDYLVFKNTKEMWEKLMEFHKSIEEKEEEEGAEKAGWRKRMKTSEVAISRPESRIFFINISN